MLRTSIIVQVCVKKRAIFIIMDEIRQHIMMSLLVMVYKHVVVTLLEFQQFFMYK